MPLLGSGATPGIQGPSRNGPSGPQGATAQSTGLQQDHVAFLTPVESMDFPAKDVARIRNLNIDPVAKGIRDVTLQHTRVTVSFRVWVGTKGHVVEVDPEAFRRIMSSSRIFMVWTVVCAWEDAYALRVLRAR
ncbi:hypothetical protein MRX96_028636 [Rhipicephalus microplus]